MAELEVGGGGARLFLFGCHELRSWLFAREDDRFSLDIWLFREYY